MKIVFRFCGLFLLFACLPALGQLASLKVAGIEVRHVGPPATSDELVRANIRVKVGDPYLRLAVDDDVRNLYATGFFYNIRVTEEFGADGLVLTYIVQGKPRLTEVLFQGNERFSDGRLRKKVTSKVGEPLDERKLFTDSQEIQKMYQNAGYPGTEVKYVLNIDETAGRGTAVFEINESRKVRIERVEFDGAQAFSQRQLRKVIKTRRHWMFSWITRGGVFKDEQFEEDRERLAQFYRERGYIDFEIRDVQFEYPSDRKMIIRFVIYEGQPYQVGSVQFTGNKIFSDEEIIDGLRAIHSARRMRGSAGPNGLNMDVGDDFTPRGLANNIEQVEDFYGGKGYIDVTTASRNLNVIRIPNTETRTMDLEFRINEGQQSYIEKIEIRGNTKTKDRVIRRELAVSPGEVFDTVRVKLSKQRLEGLQYFEKVETRPEPTDVPNRKDLVIGVEEKNTGNLTLGAGFSSVDAVVGFVEVSQGNFDLFHPPTFTGGGQKFRLRVQMGTRRQDYLVSFIEPWFLGRKLALGVDLYHRELNFQSIGNLYDEVRTGGRVSLTRALGSDFLIGSVSYTVENVGILLDRGLNETNTPQALLDEDGYSLLSKLGLSIAYDTRNHALLPNKGQRTELSVELAGGVLGGERDFYKVELRSAWYFRGLYTGHILEIVGRTGVADAYGDSDAVPFYERYYLGGLYSLRGFRYRGVGPRQEPFREPIGGNTYWFGAAEYSIPIIERVRFAFFYDIGDVQSGSYTYDFGNFSDNWGIGLRLNLPIGPLRLDYGFPIHYDRYNSGSGRFQFGVGYTREF